MFLLLSHEINVISKLVNNPFNNYYLTICGVLRIFFLSQLWCYHKYFQINLDIKLLRYSLCGGRRHDENGSPMNPGKHVQEALWLITRHSALIPHTPGHGSTHLRFWQARLDGHSGLVVHSGRQATYGSPKYSGIHGQAAARLRSLQRALEPHGDGLQGSTISVGVGGVVIRRHPTNASPVYPGSHVHRGRWLLTRHVAWLPHTPGHGSRQCWLIQARSRGHSAFTVHSGLHSM